MLGDSPDVMDVSMTFTPAIRYVQSRNTFTSSHGGIENSGNDFDFVLRQAYLEMKNVFKGAPEVTFWAGERFYDRFNTDPEDYFWLDTSGYGAGVENIDVGIGKLNIAWLGGLNDSFIGPNIGTFFKHTFDIRLKDINVGIGSLALVLIGNFEKGGTFTQTYDPVTGQLISLGALTSEGSVTSPATAVHTDSACGIDGGAIYTVHFGPGGGNNQFQAYALFGRGATTSAPGMISVQSMRRRACTNFTIRASLAPSMPEKRSTIRSDTGLGSSFISTRLRSFRWRCSGIGKKPIAVRRFLGREQSPHG